MTDLPPSWEVVSVGDLAEIQLGRQRAPQHHNGPHMRPYLRAANVTWRGAALDDVKEMNFDPDEAKTYELSAGDILLNEASGSPNEVGKPVIWNGEIPGCCFQNTLLRVRSEHVLTKYLYWYFSFSALTGRFGEAGRGVNIRHLGKQGLAAFPLPVPPFAEQDRIVAAIEEYLSRLDAADALVGAIPLKLKALSRASVDGLIDPRWPMTRLGDLTLNFDGRRVPLKKQDRDARSGPYPYYGASGVIDSLDGFLFDGDFLLIAEDGANLATRAKPIAFRAGGRFWVNNHAHVVQPVDGVDLRYLELVLNHTDIQHSISGSAQPKLTQANLNRLEVPAPSWAEQLEVVEQHERSASLVAAQRSVISSVRRRTSALRTSILTASFAGRLVSQDPTDEPASVFLERVRADRATATSSTRRRRATVS